MPRVKRTPPKVKKYRRVCQNPLCGHRGKIRTFTRSVKWKVTCPKCKRKTFIAVGITK